jgi:hypothetical protein
VEKRVLTKLGMDPNGPAVVLTRPQHLIITNKLRTALPYGTKLDKSPESIAQIRAAYRKAYRDFPDLLRIVEGHLP